MKTTTANSSHKKYAVLLVLRVRSEFPYWARTDKKSNL